MAEYIEREKALKALSEARELDDGWHSIDDIIDMVYSRIEDIPSASVRPEKHGEWLTDDSDTPYRFVQIYCSECDYFNLANIKSAYCPHCGAKMGGKDIDK